MEEKEAPPTNAISDNVLQVDYGDVVDLEDLDFDEMEAIDSIGLVLATSKEQQICCDDIKSQYCGQDVCNNCKIVCWIVSNDFCNKKEKYRLQNIG